MQKGLKRITQNLLARLDGKAVDQKGQSLVELTLTMPILLIMLLGLVEVGWLANNYLTLIDVTRSAGRWGSNHHPEDLWANNNELRYEYLDCDLENGRFGQNAANTDPVWPGPNGDSAIRIGPNLADYNYTNGTEGFQSLQYFDGVACFGVISNLSPLEFDDNRDDIVVSLFYYAVIDGDVEIVGRYPPRTNECSEDASDDSGFIHYFDVDGDLRDTGPDDIRGYIFRGNHRVSDQLGSDTGRARDCLGSEFSTSEVEELLNQSTILPPDNEGTDLEDPKPLSAEEIAQLPDGAFILIEVFWHHEQLLGLPFFSILGDPFELHVWSIFPVSGIEPDPERVIRP
jgi:hypothetical protein